MADPPTKVPPLFVVDAAQRVHRGLTAIQRRMAPPAVVLLELVTGAWRPQALGVVADLGVADLLADGPRGVDELARESGADEDSLLRVLRALARDGLFEEPEPGRFALTPLSEPLRSDHPQSMRNTVRQVMSGWNRVTWARLPDAVRTGAPQFEAVHGKDVWAFMEEHPEDASCFHESMGELTRIGAPLIAAVYDFGQHRTLVDIGGGRARLLSRILSTFPGLRGVNYDLEVALRDAPAVLREAGVEARCEIVAGSFMESVPKGYDAYMLKHIVHGMTDAELEVLFANLRGALAPGATLLLVEMVVPEHGHAGTHPAYIDLQMLVGSGGRERTASEYGALLDRQGFRLVDVRRTPSPTSVVVATRR